MDVYFWGLQGICGGRVGDQLSPIEHKGGIDKIDCLLNANE